MEEYLTHFSEGLSQSIQRYATDEVFKHSRYIFTSRLGKQQYGWCTHCSSEFKTNGLHHNTEDYCPECKSKCIVKASGRGRKGLVDHAYFVYYEKSVKDPKVIVARGIYAVRDYSGDYHFIKTKYLERARYIFEMGNSVMFERYGYYSMAKTMETHETFSQRKSVYSLSGQYIANANTTVKHSRESIKEAVKDTAFSWCGWESYYHKDMIEFFSLYSKYPCIEYLTKLKFEGLVEAKLKGDNTYSAINWRGKNLFKVLKLTKQELNDIKSQNIHVDFWFLNLLKMNRVECWGFSLSELSNVADVYEGINYLVRLRKMIKYGSMRDIVSYLSKQYDKNPKDFYSKASVLGTWEDYLGECVKLEMDLTKMNIIYPGNLSKAHQSNIKKIKYKADQLLIQQIKSRAKELQKYYFEYEGLLIKPAESSEQLIEEGNALNHCVGSYCANYAKGLTDIFFIRKADEPDKPYFTLEVKGNKITQCYGKKLKNMPCLPNEKVKAFIEKFKVQKLSSKKEKPKTRIAVPA